jgi:putative redox protein
MHLPPRLDCTWKEVCFANSAGLKISGLWYSSGQPGKPLVLVCHGFTGSKEGGDGQACRMAEYLAQIGYESLLIDFAGSGQSEGQFEDLTLSSQIDDLSCAVSWCLNKGTDFIVTLGRSFGGSTAICHAARDKRVSAVCTWAAPARPDQLFRDHLHPEQNKPGYIILSNNWETISLKKGFLEDLTSHDPLFAASQISPRPTLFLHGSQDELVPAEDLELYYAAAKEPKKRILISGADHQFQGHHQEVWEICATWLVRQL